MAENYALVSTAYQTRGPTNVQITQTFMETHRRAQKTDPKCTICSKRYCTYNETTCLKCFNATRPQCVNCSRRGWINSNNHCRKCATVIVERIV